MFSQSRFPAGWSPSGPSLCLPPPSRWAGMSPVNPTVLYWATGCCGARAHLEKSRSNHSLVFSFLCVCFVCCVFLTVFECIWLCPTVSLCLTVWVCLTMSGCVWLCPTVSLCLTVCLNYVSDCLIISDWLCPTVCRVWRWTDRTTKWKDSISSQSILFELRPSIGTDQERPLRRSASPHTQTVSSNYVCL